MQKYELDLETLLSLLEGMHQNSILFTNVPSGFLGQKTSCQVRIDLVAGRVAYCHIEDSEGRIHVLGNKNAFSLFYDMGPLEWFVETRLPDTPSSLADTNASLPGTMPPAITRPLPAIPSHNTKPLRKISSIVPRQIVNVEPQFLQRLSRNQRRVLVLVDGTRNIEKITSILYSSPQDNMQIVLKTLRELESLGLITMGG